MPGDDAPPREAVEAMYRTARLMPSGSMVDLWLQTSMMLRTAQNLPAAARWRLIGWLADGLEPTEAMLDAADYAEARPVSRAQHKTICRAMLAAAREGGGE